MVKGFDRITVNILIFILHTLKIYLYIIDTYFDIRCDSVKKLQEKLNFLREYFNDALTFKSIYRYAYDFAKVSFTYTYRQSLLFY